MFKSICQFLNKNLEDVFVPHWVLRLFADLYNPDPHFLFTFAIVYNKNYSNKRYVTSRWVSMIKAPFGKFISYDKVFGKYIVKNDSDIYSLEPGDGSRELDLHHVLIPDEKRKYNVSREIERKAFSIVREKLKEKMLACQNDLAVCKIAAKHGRLYVNENGFYNPRHF